MSFEAAIDRIGQIVQFQQQIFDPAADASSSASAGQTTTTSGSSSNTSGSTSATFAAALAQAESASDATLASGTGSDDGDDDTLAAGDDPLAGDVATLSSALPLSATTTPPSTSAATAAGATTAGTAVEATSVDDPRVQAMTQEADSLLGKPYVWGGGHSGWGPQSGYDCSGFVSAVLHAGGYLSSPQDTTTLPSAAGIEAGPGQYVTIYDRDDSGEEGHVIIDIAGQFYESGGEAGPWGGGGGVEKIATPSAAYLATFNDVLHPAGL